MSANGQQAQALNKKQRRKNARANKSQETRPPDDEHEEINSTPQIPSTQTSPPPVVYVPAPAPDVPVVVPDPVRQAEDVCAFDPVHSTERSSRCCVEYVNHTS